MLPFNPCGHTAYQDFLVSQLRKHYPNPDSIPKDVWEIIEKFYLKDLSGLDEFLRDSYSIFGPKPRLPSAMMRSVLLSLEFQATSVTQWARQMKINTLYAILSGFEPGDTPGVGTFYDFFDRLWLSENDNLSPHERQPKPSVKKPKGKSKGTKADSVEKVTVDQLIQKYQSQPLAASEPFSRLFDIFKREFLDESVRRGLINPDCLDLAGDGTPVVTSAQMRKKRICDCKEKGVTDCSCERYYSQPDCDIGWDSHRECFYHGYDLYLLTAAGACHDLPIFPLFGPASRHDAIGFVHAWFTMKAMLPDYTVHKLLLDSAHDAMPVYQYCRQNGIVPFIDLNAKRGAKLKYKDDFTVGEDGVPICPAGHKMCHDGVEKSKMRAKFRCPKISRKYGCSCESPCSDSKYGRTVHVAMKDNPRIFNIPPRGSEEWKLQYNARTSAERANKRIKVDYKLEGGRHRSSKMWYCRLYCIMMCQHLDAWGLPDASPLKGRILQAA